MRYTYPFVLILLISCSFASGSVSIKVEAIHGEPLPYAVIKYKGKRVTTGSGGWVKLDSVPVGKYSLELDIILMKSGRSIG
jgi:hypothetical protein